MRGIHPRPASGELLATGAGGEVFSGPAWTTGEPSQGDGGTEEAPPRLELRRALSAVSRGGSTGAGRHGTALPPTTARGSEPLTSAPSAAAASLPIF